MTNFVKAFGVEGKAFKYLQSKFHNSSAAKIKAGVFAGPHIRHLLKDVNFEKIQ